MPTPQQTSKPPEPTDELILPSRHNHPLWWRVLLIIAGVFLIILGMIGWLIPIVTGVPFYIVAFIILAAASHRIRRAINWLDRKLPTRVRIALRSARDRIQKIRKK